MTGAILLSLMLAGPPVESSYVPSAQPASFNTASDSQAGPQTLAEWRTAVHDSLRNQATAKDLDQPAAVLRVAALYRLLGQDSQIDRGEQKRLRLLLRGRLVHLREQLPLETRLRLARVDVVTRRAKAEHKPELLKKIEDDKAILAQWQGALAQFAPPAAAGGNNALHPADDGQRLVELIQAIVTPDFWDVNGGPGVVSYFPSLHVLVISGTTETHENVAGLLDALRRAGN